jgi:hypothetical protein
MPCNMVYVMCFNGFRICNIYWLHTWIIQLLVLLRKVKYSRWRARRPPYLYICQVVATMMLRSIVLVPISNYIKPAHIFLHYLNTCIYHNKPDGCQDTVKLVVKTEITYISLSVQLITMTLVYITRFNWSEKPIVTITKSYDHFYMQKHSKFSSKRTKIASKRAAENTCVDILDISHLAQCYWCLFLDIWCVQRGWWRLPTHITISIFRNFENGCQNGW